MLTINQTLDHFGDQFDHKAAVATAKPSQFFVSAMLAGAYVGIGIVLILVLGSVAPEPVRKLIMGGTFGIALTLVVLAGADLFTGYNMYGAIAWLQRRSRPGKVVFVWVLCWLGNLLGAAALVALVKAGGGSGIDAESGGLLHAIAGYKMNASAGALLARGALCNWLVCLALWMAARVDSDVARCISIWWCLLAFIACGFEHSVANMTLLLLALVSDPGAGVSLGGLAHNLGWVTLGNIFGGGLFVGASYWFVGGSSVKTY